MFTNVSSVHVQGAFTGKLYVHLHVHTPAHIMTCKSISNIIKFYSCSEFQAVKMDGKNITKCTFFFIQVQPLNVDPYIEWIC